MQIADHLEHIALKPDTVVADIEAVCNDAVEYKLRSVCVPPLFVKTAKMLLADTGITVCAVIGFPFGYSAIEAKVAEIVLAIIDEADELDLVINTSAVKNGDWQFLANEINNIMPIVRGRGKKLAVVLEAALFTHQEIIAACDMYGAAGVDAIQIGTGFTDDTSATAHVELTRKHLAGAIEIKVATAIKSYSFAAELIKAGANRLCCNNGTKLIQQALQQN